ncbi:DsbA family oxidoreductase [Solibacillus daqui]|uniref:DsbA family oxidoreductase n=1 Tax=Solibacillus daqui TaxID=2912187 RepID=UPI0023662A86|nr:DsbA family oxidoreductase [Solibacillus daqui]
MKIEVWSDYVCPFCYIGKTQLEHVLEQAGYGEAIEVELKSYLLDPTVKEDASEPIYEGLQQKYGMSIEEVKKMTQNVVARASEVGLAFNFDDMKNANTVKAHRLAKWAETKDKGKAFSERVLKAYFTEGQLIGHDETLLNLAEEVGLERQQAQAVLANDDYLAEMQQDIAIAQQLGVRGVPFFVIDQKYGISGAQPKEVFEQAIEKAAQEAGLRKPLKMQGGNGITCTDESCGI